MGSARFPFVSEMATVVGFAVVLAVAPWAEACEEIELVLGFSEGWSVDLDLEDEVAPAALEVEVNIDARTFGPFAHECDTDHLGVELVFSGGEDEHSSFDELGLDFELVSGSYPGGGAGLKSLVDGGPILLRDTTLETSFHHEPYDLILAVTPYDRAGNPGPMTLMDLSWERGISGCAVVTPAPGKGAPAQLGLGLGLMVLGLGCLARQRRN